MVTKITNTDPIENSRLFLSNVKIKLEIIIKNMVIHSLDVTFPLNIISSRYEFKIF